MSRTNHNRDKPAEPDRGPRRSGYTTAERAHAALVVGLLGPIVPVLAQALEPRTEVVLHDLTRMPATIAAIGGTITGREVGGPVTDLGLRAFRPGRVEHLIRYRTEMDGMAMRSSSIFFDAPSGNPVVCLCINTDIAAFEEAQRMLSAVTAIATPGKTRSPTPIDAETFPGSIDALAEGLIQDAIAGVGVPVELMKKTHKLDVVRELESRGFFTIRDGINLAAQHLSVSRPTIYNYLNEVAADEPGSALGRDPA
ncbi:helix-turn-helix transcriptional regulator [Amycolatopsis jejuensis]|uniref:helix-turn-helix transcriptional regulator n=1 Tax=Amycolatopsis jejuensis TaxID=330084 RepID=UPI00068EC238|nr:PAS domain-containing protein [Amycolatopsis jejuensis]